MLNVEVGSVYVCTASKSLLFSTLYQPHAGLSPKNNMQVPVLRPHFVYQLKTDMNDVNAVEAEGARTSEEAEGARTSEHREVRYVCIYVCMCMYR